jgi:hypothetical protein
MPNKYGIYYESQRGGLCRLHSINQYFGLPKISEANFNLHIQNYDNEYKKLYNLDTSCKTWDIVSSDQKNIVSYVLKKNKIYTRYYAINQIYDKGSQYILNILNGNVFFIFNEGHIWNIRKYNEKWYSVNSIGGVHPINIHQITSQKNIGFIVPVNIQTEFYYNLAIIQKIFKKNKNDEGGKENNLQNIKDYLIKSNKEKKILGELEVPINIIMDIMGTIIKSHKLKQDFEVIQKHIKNYNIFLLKFTNGNYNNINLILEYLPFIIFDLLNLKY